MALSKRHIIVVCAVFGISACSFATDALFPSMTGEEAEAREIAANDGQARVLYAEEPPPIGATAFEPPTVTPGSPTGTFVGGKVQSWRSELGQLQNQIRRRNEQLHSIRNAIVENAQRYHGTVAAISARLQVGTTPGNPILMQQWNEAQDKLNLMNEEVVRLNRLSADVASDSAMAGYLLDSVRAARNLSGAVDEDHRQLRILEDETNQTVVLIQRLLAELNRDVTRQQQYVQSEKSNLSALAVAIKSGHFYTGAVTAREFAAADGSPVAAVDRDQRPTDRSPLVVIRFDRPNVDYEPALYQAVSRALDRRPGATFDLVAVTPADGTGSMGAHVSRQNAERVLRSLSQMGLPTDRVRLSAARSAQAQASEVHLFLR